MGRFKNWLIGSTEKEDELLKRSLATDIWMKNQPVKLCIDCLHYITAIEKCNRPNKLTGLPVNDPCEYQRQHGSCGEFGSYFKQKVLDA